VRRLIPALSLVALLPVASSWAQLSPPNKAGVTMGLLSYRVRDVAAHKKFWIRLGATPIKVGQTDVMKFPDVLIFLTQGEPSGGNEGSVVKHVTFRVPNVAEALTKFEAEGLKVQRNRNNLQGYVFTPDGESVEFFQEMTEISGFTVDEGQDDRTAQRFSRKMTVPIATHHVHLYVPEGSEAQAKAWYVDVFGAVPGKRWHYDAADIPGMNLNFSGSPVALAPTRGRTMDHIGFEVKNLEAFCKKLQASGVKIDVPYHKQPTGIASAFLTDPWGTYIELTQGLDRF
jgi:catechol 2,3-dioxygenase-like lactoylglutathione lyase family enzyme